MRKDTRGLGVLKGFKGEAAILIELGGIGNKKTRNAILRNSSKIGREIATGIYEYLYGKKPPKILPRGPAGAFFELKKQM